MVQNLPLTRKTMMEVLTMRLGHSTVPEAFIQRETEETLNKYPKSGGIALGPFEEACKKYVNSIFAGDFAIN